MLEKQGARYISTLYRCAHTRTHTTATSLGQSPYNDEGTMPSDDKNPRADPDDLGECLGGTAGPEVLPVSLCKAPPSLGELRQRCNTLGAAGRTPTCGHKSVRDARSPSMLRGSQACMHKMAPLAKKSAPYLKRKEAHIPHGLRQARRIVQVTFMVGFGQGFSGIFRQVCFFGVSSFSPV